MMSTSNFMIVSKDVKWVEQAGAALDLVHPKHTVDVVSDGEKLIDAMEKNCTDCEFVFETIIVDYRMTLWSYFKTIREMDNWPLQRIVVLGADLPSEAQVRCFSDGIDLIQQDDHWWKQLAHYMNAHRETTPIAK